MYSNFHNHSDEFEKNYSKTGNKDWICTTVESRPSSLQSVQIPPTTIFQRDHFDCIYTNIEVFVENRATVKEAATNNVSAFAPRAR